MFTRRKPVSSCGWKWPGCASRISRSTWKIISWSSAASAARSPEWRAYRQMEIRFGEFSTAVEIPLGVDVSKADADYKDGFLNVILPKLKPTNIIIKG